MKIISQLAFNPCDPASFIGCQFRCQHCSAVIELEDSDVVAEHIGEGTNVPFRGLMETEWYLPCPVCNRQIKFGRIHAQENEHGLIRSK